MNTLHDISVILVVLMASTVSCTHTALITGQQASVENRLVSIDRSGEVPADFSVTYDDMHGLWGGATIVIRGNGVGERRVRAREDAQPDVVEVSIPREQLTELIKLLIQHEAWKQNTPERESVPDESRAILTISVGGQTSRIWEWFNEMTRNDRLIKIQTKMKEMTK